MSNRIPESLQYSSFLDAARLWSSGQSRIVIKNDILQRVDIPKRSWRQTFASTPATELDQNRRAWTAFKRSIQGEFSEQRLASIACNYKRYGISISQKIKEGSPLLPSDVQKIGIAAAFLKTSDIRREGEKLSQLTPCQIKERLRLADPYHAIGDPPRHERHHGGPTSLMEYLFPFNYESDRRILHISEDSQYLSKHPHAYVEHYVKGLIGLEPPDGMILPAPVPGERGMDYYAVSGTIDKKGLFAQLLIPISEQSKLPLLFGLQPTKTRLYLPGAHDALREDSKPDIGKDSYLAAKPELEALLAKAKEQNKEIIAGGYSKGGAELAHFFMDNWAAFSEVIFYNDPSISKEEVEEFARKINALPRQPRTTKITIYRTKNDVAHFGGEKHVGWGIRHPDFIVRVIEIEHPSYQSVPNFRNLGGMLDRHGQRHFTINDITYGSTWKIYEGVQADAQLDNTKRGDEVMWYEKFRRKWGMFIFSLTLSLYRALRCIMSCLGLRPPKEVSFE